MPRSMLDAAWPPSRPPRVDVVAFYIGGGTPHVWTAAEVADTMRKAGATGKLPIFVRVPPTSRNPRDEAAWVVSWLRSHGAPAGVCHALDYETAVNNAYVDAYDSVIVAAGYRTLLYGSLGTVVQNHRPSGGYWAAHWNNTPHICTSPGVVATQYGGDVTIGQPWDISLVADSVPLWDRQEADDMFEPEHARQLKAIYDQILGAVGAGQTSFQGTVEAILATTQALVNEGRGTRATVVAKVEDSEQAIITYLAAHPATADLPPEWKAEVVGGVVAGLRDAGLDPDPTRLLDAMALRLAA